MLLLMAMSFKKPTMVEAGGRRCEPQHEEQMKFLFSFFEVIYYEVQKFLGSHKCDMPALKSASLWHQTIRPQSGRGRKEQDNVSQNEIASLHANKIATEYKQALSPKIS